MVIHDYRRDTSSSDLPTAPDSRKHQKGPKTSRHCNCQAAIKHLTDIKNTPIAYRDQGRTFYTTLAVSLQFTQMGELIHSLKET